MAGCSPDPASRLATAREVALSYLDRRMHGRLELARKLRRRRFVPSVVNDVLDELEACGHIDDEAFARAFATDRVRLAPRGYALVITELLARGVDRTTAARAVRRVEAEHPELGVARAFVASRARRLAAIDSGLRRRRLAIWLGGRGFGSDTIAAILDDVDRHPDD